MVTSVVSESACERARTQDNTASSNRSRNNNNTNNNKDPTIRIAYQTIARVNQTIV